MAREELAKKIILIYLLVVVLSCFTLIGLVIWDLSSGVQTVTGRCVWAGYCLWIGGLSSLGISLVFLIVNLMAYSGFVRSSSWSEQKPSRGPKMVYPWLLVYAFLNLILLPVVIVFLYLWYDKAPEECSSTFPSICKSQILSLWVPLVSVASVIILLIFLHNWVVVLRVTLSLRRKLSPLPFTRIGDKIVLGLQHSKEMERKNTLLNGELIADLSFDRYPSTRSMNTLIRQSIPISPARSICTCSHSGSTLDRRSTGTRSSKIETGSLYENKTRF